jgi:hypothetical protein
MPPWALAVMVSFREASVTKNGDKGRFVKYPSIDFTPSQKSKNGLARLEM